LAVFFLDVYWRFAIYGWETLPGIALRIHNRFKPDLEKELRCVLKPGGLLAIATALRFATRRA
jgi:hypothetical protein